MEVGGTLWAWDEWPARPRTTSAAWEEEEGGVAYHHLPRCPTHTFF